MPRSTRARQILIPRPSSRVCALTLDFLRRPPPVDHRFFLGDTPRVGRAGLVLRLRLWRPGERGDDQPRAERGELVVEHARRIRWRDRQRLLQQDGARVEPRVHLHDGDAGRRIPGEKGALDRRGATPPWQQGRMHVEAAARRRAEQGRGHHEPVGGDHDHFRAHRAHGRDGLGIERGRLQQRQAPGLRQRLDRGRLRLQAASGRPVGLREHERDFMARLE
jgi:hypothetical protein